MVLHSPKESEIHSMEELKMKMSEPGTTSFDRELENKNENIDSMLPFPPKLRFFYNKNTMYKIA